MIEHSVDSRSDVGGEEVEQKGGTVINDCFIRVSEIGEALTAYIGSEECKIAQSCIDDSHSGFLSGIGMAGVVILSKCQKYVLRRYASEGEGERGTI